MQLLSFDKTLHRRAALRSNAVLACALKMLWQAHHYAIDTGEDAWEFAVEIDELRRAQVSHSELRWLLSQGYAAHALETAPKNGRRRYRRTRCASLADASCFVITAPGVELFESLGVAASWTQGKVQHDSTCTTDEDCSFKRHAPTDAKPTWNAQRRELWLDDRLVKRFRQRSSNQQAILDLFAAMDWPHRIADPLPLIPALCPKRRLHDAVKRLNRHHRHQAIRFSGDGSGSGVLWARID